MARKCILFMAEAVTLAHVARPVVLAQGLDSNAYEVCLACDPRFSEIFSNLPMTTRPLYSISCERFARALAKGRAVYDAQTLRTYVKEDLRIIAEIAPDLVVGDFRLSLAVSTAVTGTPYLAISNAYWSPYARQRFPVPELPLTRMFGVTVSQWLFDLVRPMAFGLHALPLNRIRREYGLPSLGLDLRRTYTCADHTLYADIPDLIPTRGLPDNHHYIGPLLWSANAPLPDWWEALPRDRPIIYVTLGSSGRGDRLPVVLEALADLSVTVIAATAGRARIGSAPRNAFVSRYLPGDRAVARAQLVVCNGGSPTSYQALAKGVPVLGIAGNLDQHLNMQALQRAGAGERLRSEHADLDSIRGAVTRIMSQPEYSQAARRLAALFAQYDAVSRFEALVAELIESNPSIAPKN